LRASGRSVLVERDVLLDRRQRALDAAPTVDVDLDAGEREADRLEQVERRAHDQLGSCPARS
jgi:hypothetical protein